MMKFKRQTLISTSLVAIVAIGISGCADNMTGDLQSQVSQLETQVSEKDRLLKAAEANAKASQAAAQAAQARAEEMARKSAMTPQPVAATSGQDLPPNAKAGECYARVFLPAKYKSTTETLLVRQEAERILVRPAVYRPASKRVLYKSTLR